MWWKIFGSFAFGCVTPQPTQTTDILPEIFYCPGDPSGVCDDAEGTLRAGASAIPITPPCFESWEDTNANAEMNSDEAFFDCGCDRLCDGDEGYPGKDDGESDGEFQAVWLAGFHNGRPAAGVHDPLWARAIVFDQGQTRVGVVVLDLVGWFYPEVVATRQLASESGLGIDQLIIASTHNHEGPDTMGLWGEGITRSGYDPEYALFVQETSVEALKQAVARLTDVGRIVSGSVDAASYDDSGIGMLIRDSRDPKVIDAQLSAILVEDTTGQTIATLSHFGNHPEVMGADNLLITSDYPGVLRDSLENGLTYDTYSRNGYGGTSIYINGLVGGLMTPLGVTVVDGEGTKWSETSWERMDAMGTVMAEMAMDAIDGGQDLDLNLSTASKTFMVPVENYGFQAMFLSGIVDRQTHEWDPTRNIDENNLPHVQTEISWLRLGDLEWLTVPGELFPELAIGGYDGSQINTPGLDVIDPDNENPPDLDAAPEPPYLRDRLPSTQAWIVGLGNDELGYIIPSYDFELNDLLPWFDQAPGDHYEETNSLGPQTAPIVTSEAVELLSWIDAHMR